jgi:predicted TIM-barrel fold metal-dependent hydrolase
MPLPPLPAGACDCHVHVVAGLAEHPMLADRHYTPGPARHDDLVDHMAWLGLARTVIVQPSIYGTDNSLMLHSLWQLSGAGRGVAVVDDDIDELALRALDRQGVRGLRINVESAGQQDPGVIGKALAFWASRVADLGWHLQVYASLDAMAAAVPHIAALPVPIVLDHFAMIPAAIPLDDERVQSVVSLVRSGRAYVKLSAPYRIDPAGGSRAMVARLAAEFLRANPERVVWGSDWPHTNREPGKAAHQVSAYRSIAPATLLEDLHAWLPDRPLREQVLVANPARLYGFAA